MPRKALLDRPKQFEALFLYTQAADREALSTRGLADHFKKSYGLEIDQSNVSRAVASIQKQIAEDPAIAQEYETWKVGNAESGKTFFTFDTSSGRYSSEYVTVQKYIDYRTGKPRGAGDLTTTLRRAQKCWLFLDHKDPANWTLKDVKKYLSEGRNLKSKPLSSGDKETYMISARAVAPLVKSVENGTLEYKQENRRQNPIVKSPVFTREYKIITGNTDIPDYGRFAFRLQTVLGCREGSDENEDDALKGRQIKAASIIGLDWEDWDPRTQNLRVYESKVVGWWNNIPLDVLDPNFRVDFIRYWETRGKPASGPVLEIGESVNARYEWLTDLYAQIKRSHDFLQGKRWTPHFARKSHVNILWEAGVPLEIIAGDARGNEGYVGVGWTDLQTLKDYYLALSKSKLNEYREKAKTHFVSVGVA